MNLFVAGLPFDMDDQELKEIFEVYGTVSSARIILDRETHKSRGFGFVEMSNDTEAKTAMERLDGGQLEGRNLAVRVAEERKNNGPGARRSAGFGPDKPRNSGFKQSNNYKDRNKY